MCVGGIKPQSHELKLKVYISSISLKATLRPQIPCYELFLQSRPVLLTAEYTHNLSTWKKDCSTGQPGLHSENLS